MRFGFGDPPYPGQAKKHYGAEAEADGRVAREVNLSLFVRYLCDEYPDGWALCTSSPALRDVLNIVPEDCRVGVWVKPFCSFKPNVTRAYAWEPVIFRGGRPIPRTQPTVRDFVSSNILLKKGVSGAKPYEFMRWVLEFLNVQPGDEVDDLFPGSGMSQIAIDQFLGRASEPQDLFDLFTG